MAWWRRDKGRNRTGGPGAGDLRSGVGAHVPLDARLDDRVREAFDVAPRAYFLPEEARSQASFDGPFSIGHGQTNSQPRTVAAMLELLDVRPGHRVLDVGSGSGWTTGLLAALAGPDGEVLGLEIVPELAEWGAANLATLLADAAAGPAGSTGDGRADERADEPADERAGEPADERAEDDGTLLAPARIEQADPDVLGRPDEGPWDRILVSAMAARRPDALIGQLAEGGRLVCPVAGQMLLVELVDGQPRTSGHGAYRFVPLLAPDG